MPSYEQLMVFGPGIKVSGDVSALPRSYYRNQPAATAMEGLHGVQLDFGSNKFAGNADLLDLSTPTAPTVVTAGLYSVTMTAWGNPAADSAKGLFVELDFDSDASDFPGPFVTVPLGTADHLGFDAHLAGIGYVPAGGVISVFAKHEDTDQTVDVNLDLWLMKLA